MEAAWFSQLLEHDAITVAAIVGAIVPDLELGTSAVPILGRHPVVVSSQAQTAQAASDGRFTLGVGIGARNVTEAAFGIERDRPIRHLREYLTVLSSLLTTGEVDFDGEALSAHTLHPARVAGAEEAPGVLVAAMGSQSLALA